MNTTPDQLTAMLAQMTPERVEQFWAENPHLLHMRPDGPPTQRALEDLLENAGEVTAKIYQSVQDEMKAARSQGMAGSGPAKRLRQSTKPLLNKLETAFWEWMKDTHPEITLRPQAITLKIANGLRYTADFFALVDGKPTFWETKGKWVDGDSFPKLKMAAAAFPECEFILVWRSGGEWKFQEVLA